MKKQILALSVLIISSSLYAQQTSPLGEEDVWAAFQQYNPAALDKASSNAVYREVIAQLAASYSAPRTLENEDELMAVVKNFDNSLYLQALRNAYFEKRTWQEVSGQSLDSLDDHMWQSLFPIAKSIYQNTLELRQFQLKRAKNQLKAVRRDKTLTEEQRTSEIARLRQQIKQTKQILRDLKKDQEPQLWKVCDAYLADMQDAFAQAQAQQLQADQSATRDVKANHKKPVAQ